MSTPGPSDNVNLGQQSAQAAAALQQQQAQWQAEQNATNLASNVQSQTAQQATQQQNAQDAVQQQGYNTQNQTQGVGQNATGGPAGIKAAATIQGNTAGISPADAMLQAASSNASPTSLQSLMMARNAAGSNVQQTGSNTLQAPQVKLGGS